jgi:predicted transcriptional regulator/Holliday junction resolvase-like predicted endonuclease
MTAKTEVILALLKHSSSGPTTKSVVAKEAGVSVDIFNSLLHDFHENGFLEVQNKNIKLTSNQRVNLAIHAINQGTDVERVCKVLEWKEFENFSAVAFEKNNFAVKRRFRFKAAQRRWEIDVIACSEPIIVCVDCKRWRRGWGNSAINKIAVAQAQRAEVLAINFQDIQRKIGIKWKNATLFPVILSLFPGQIKMYNHVPVVPILQLQNFLDEFQGHTSELLHFKASTIANLPDYC